MIEISIWAAEKLSGYPAENNLDSVLRIAAMNGCGC